MQLEPPRRPSLDRPTAPARRSGTGPRHEPRDYQEAAIRAVFGAWEKKEKKVQRPAVVLPTGAGKTVVFANLIRRVLERINAGDWPWGPGPVVVLAHRKELIDQAMEKLLDEDPTLRLGVVKGTRDEIYGVQVIVASVQSLGNGRAEKISRLRPGLIVVDEAHHYVSETYFKALTALGAFLPDGPRVLGVSATLARTDKRRLGDLWEEVVFELPIKELIDRGYLLVPKGRRVKIEGLSDELDEVKKTGGDLNKGGLAQALNKTAAPDIIAATYAKHASDRQGIVFCVNVELSKKQVEAFRAIGISAAHVDGSMHEIERGKIIKAYKAGKFQVLCNCNVFTEGFDAPNCSAVVVRPTISRSLYIQMVGRGLRPHPGQTDCLVFDIDAGRSRHSLASVTDLELDRVEVDKIDEEIIEGGEEIEEERAARELIEVRGRTVVEEFDYFAEQKKDPHATPWRQTYRGVWFIETRDGLIVLLHGADIGRYQIGLLSREGTGQIIHDDLPIKAAFAKGQARARMLGGPLTTAAKKSPWKAGPPTDNQRSLASSLGLRFYEATTSSGDLSHMISVHVASQILDGLHLAQAVTREGYWRDEHIFPDQEATA